MTFAPSDQAGDLRRLVEAQRQDGFRKDGAALRTIAVLSGKGGVGKSNLALALSCALADGGKRVVLLDADLGMANIDLLCGIGSPLRLRPIFVYQTKQPPLTLQLPSVFIGVSTSYPRAYLPI